MVLDLPVGDGVKLTEMTYQSHLLVFVAVTAAVSAQSPTKPAFEVAAIRPNKSADAVPRIGFPPGRFEAVAATVQQLISYAYADRQPLRSSQIIGAPSWIGTERFDIAAVIATGPSRSPNEMLRALLAERFRLTVHSDRRELPTYALVRLRKDGTLGSRLRPAPLDCDTRAAQAPPGTPGIAVCGGGPIPGGVMGRTMKMENLAGSLSSAVDRVVIDRTGLEGNYDWDLEWKEEGPSVFTALQEQLGLKLEPDRALLPVIVIDSVDRPTEN